MTRFTAFRSGYARSRATTRTHVRGLGRRRRRLGLRLCVADLAAGVRSVEERPATVYGWHRALAMRSRVNRGTPECPGLVFALVPGGSCRGRAYRIELRASRPSSSGSGAARCRPASTTRSGCAAARRKAWCAASPSRSAGRARATPAAPEGELVEILRTANGRYGSTLSYLVETERSLRSCGIRDRDVERLVALARRHSLTA